MREERLDLKAVPTWIALAPPLALLPLGVLFIAAPRFGAAIFGIAPPEEPGLGYLRAIGLRDLAFGLYVLTLAALASRRAVGTVLLITVLIPAGDLVLVAVLGGGAIHLFLHLLSGAMMAAAGAWILMTKSTRGGPT